MPLTVTVIDVGGVVRATLAEDGSGPTRANVAYAKASTCLAFGASSNTLRGILEDQQVTVENILWKGINNGVEKCKMMLLTL